MARMRKIGYQWQQKKKTTTTMTATSKMAGTNEECKRSKEIERVCAQRLGKTPIFYLNIYYWWRLLQHRLFIGEYRNAYEKQKNISWLQMDSFDLQYISILHDFSLSVSCALPTHKYIYSSIQFVDSLEQHNQMQWYCIYAHKQFHWKH